jgi:hypothetical protein
MFAFPLRCLASLCLRHRPPTAAILQDLAEPPFTLQPDSTLLVPDGAGLGVQVEEARVLEAAAAGSMSIPITDESSASAQPEREHNMSFADTTIAFIGSGVMAEAMIKGLVHQGLVSGDQIIAADPHRERVLEMVSRYNVHAAASNAEAARSAQIVVIATKPQVLAEVAAQMEGAAEHASLVLSILAGVRIRTLSNALGN